MTGRPNIFMKTIAIVLSCCILAHCNSYRRVAPHEPQNLDLTAKTIVLHHGTDQIFMTDLVLNPDNISGVLASDTVTKTQNTNNVLTTTSKPRKVKTKDKVHLYLSSPIDDLGSVDDTVSISYSNIETIEVYEKEKGKTAIFGIGTVGMLGAAVFGVFAIIAILIKSSCPFIYVDSGNGFTLAGEIFSGATFPQIERHDYLRLPEMKLRDNNYQLLVTNEVKEIQHINLLEMLVIDHEEGTEALIDKYGNVRIYSNPATPLSAINASGKDILPAIALRDSLFYLTGNDQTENETPVDYITLDFKKPPGSDSACLIIRAKNHAWLDYSYGMFHNQLGKFYDKWLKKQQKVPAEELHQWAFDQKIPLAVYIKKDSVWEYTDLFNVAGPIAMKDDVLPLDLSEISGETVSIKLESGFRFWEIDFAALDFSTSATFSTTSVAPNYAKDLDSTDVSSLIACDDDAYYIQYEVGEEALISFPAPPQKSGMARTTILHTKGYYEILMDPPDFRPRISELKKLYGPLQFTQFSKDYYLRLYKKELSINE